MRDFGPSPAQAHKIRLCAIMAGEPQKDGCVPH
jgi:hypothetical protein